MDNSNVICPRPIVTNRSEDFLPSHTHFAPSFMGMRFDSRPSRNKDETSSNPPLSTAALDSRDMSQGSIASLVRHTGTLASGARPLNDGFGYLYIGCCLSIS